VTLQSQYAVAQDQDFVGRVCMSALIYAKTVSAEVSSTPNYNNRIDLARRFANDPVALAQKMAYLIASDATAEGGTDTTIHSLVQAGWNTMAGMPPV